MNVIAGILIGWFNDLWLARLLLPFAWGVLWCGYKWTVSGHAEFEEKMKGRPAPPRAGSHKAAYYRIEYFTASITAFVLSIACGAIKTLFT